MAEVDGDDVVTVGIEMGVCAYKAWPLLRLGSTISRNKGKEMMWKETWKQGTRGWCMKASQTKKLHQKVCT